MKDNRFHPDSSELRAIVVGGGLSGVAVSLMLAREGYQVDLFEKREPYVSSHFSGKSMAITLSERGLGALETLGIRGKLVAQSARLFRRATHSADGVTLRNYGPASQCLYAIERQKLLQSLTAEAKNYPQLKRHYGFRAHVVSKQAQSIEFVHTATGETQTHNYDLLIGADGAFSEVREQMQRGEPADLHRRFCSWGYVELKTNSEKINLDQSSFHAWPGSKQLLLSIPTLTRGFNFILFRPVSLPTEGRCIDLVAGLEEALPGIAGFLSKEGDWRLRPLVSIRTSMWTYQNSIALVGDAAHSTFPFLGQGTNAGFEDCAFLVSCLKANPTNRALALAQYEAEQKPNGHALETLSDEHLADLNHEENNKRTSAQFLNSRLASQKEELYHLIANTSTPFSVILKRKQEQLKTNSRRGRNSALPTAPLSPVPFDIRRLKG